MILQTVLHEFLLTRKLAGLTKKSVRDYEEFVSKFVSRHPELELGELTQEHIDSYLLDLYNREISQATFSTYTRHLKIFLHWAAETYPPVLYDYTKIKVPKMSKRQVRLYSDSEIRLIFDTISDIYHDNWVCIRNKCIVALMLDSGLRQSEVSGLLWSWVSFGSGMLRVNGKGNKERMVPLGRTSEKLLLSYRDICPYHENFVFAGIYGKQLTSNAIRLFVRRIKKELPFEFSSHKLRHNYATNYCLDQYQRHGSIDIYKLMYLLGHEDIETTRRYLHIAYEIIAAQNNISHLDMIF